MELSTSNQGLKQKQSEIIKLQDYMLQDISQGIDGLHHKALAINDESKMHTRLLEDLDSNVDMATAALQVSLFNHIQLN